MWDEAAELADQRRVVDPVEEALPGFVKELEKNAGQLSDGRKFISTTDLLSYLRMRMGSPVRSNGLAGWMEKLGWKYGKYRLPGASQTRGYAK